MSFLLLVPEFTAIHVPGGIHFNSLQKVKKYMTHLTSPVQLDEPREDEGMNLTTYE